MRIFVGELVMASARKEWNGNEIFDDLESALPRYANILVQNVTFILRDILSPEEASNHEILYIRKPLRPERSIVEKMFLETLHWRRSALPWENERQFWSFPSIPQTGICCSRYILTCKIDICITQNSGGWASKSDQTSQKKVIFKNIKFINQFHIIILFLKDQDSGGWAPASGSCEKSKRRLRLRRGEESHRGDGGDHSTLDEIEVVGGQRGEQRYRGDHSTLDDIEVIGDDCNINDDEVAWKAICCLQGATESSRIR